MGAATSKPVQTPATAAKAPEKPGFPVEHAQASTTRSNRSQSVPIHHHASADRLHRIAGQNHLSEHEANQNEDRPANVGLRLDDYKAWQAKIEDDPVARLASLTLHAADIKASLHSRKSEVSGSKPVFNTVIDHENSTITNQASSGRCWLFATCNIIRNIMAKTLNVEEFELSQSYLFFADHCEKANYFLETALALYDVPIDEPGRGGQLKEAVNDGGQWDMAVNLLLKYGVVPKAVYPESWNSSSTGGIDKLTTTKLRQASVRLRKLKSETIARLTASGVSLESAEDHANTVARKAKNQYLEEIFKLLLVTNGAPPRPDENFTYEYRDRQGKYRCIESTPLDFLSKYAPSFNPRDYASLVHDPRHDADVLMTVDRLGNVIEGFPVRYVSVSMDDLKAATIRQIKAGHPAWYGCDVGQSSDTKAGVGILDSDLFDYKAAFGMDFAMTKAERIEMGESTMTHGESSTDALVQNQANVD